MRSIPLSLQEKINKANQTIYEKANPQMGVQVRRAKTTLTDTDLFYVETIREKAGLGDISLALYRPYPDKAPTFVYEIHNDNGIIKTTLRDLSDFREDRWKHQFDVGPGKACSIEFDGYWVMDSQQRYNLVTEDKPWIFWTDNDNNLYAQKWNNAATKELLATDVIKVQSLRGWKNVEKITDDQGLIVCYIKTDGKVYYRNYAVQEDRTTIWEVQKEITGGWTTANNIGLFRTNDYRTGVLVESSGNIYMILTYRNWAGMAVKPDHLTGKFGGITAIDLIPIEYIDVAETERLTGKFGVQAIGLCTESAVASTVTSAEITGARELTLIFSNPLAGDLSRIKNYLTVSNESLTVYYSVASTSIGSSNNKLIITVSTDIDTENNVKIAYTDMGMIFTRPEPSAMMGVGSFSIVAPGLVADPVHNINLTGRFNMQQVILTEVFYSSTEPAHEHLTGKFNGFTTITLTKVGTGDI